MMPQYYWSRAARIKFVFDFVRTELVLEPLCPENRVKELLALAFGLEVELTAPRRHRKLHWVTILLFVEVPVIDD